MTESGLSAAQLHTLAKAAGAAPSLHNTQPWRFEAAADGRTLAVYVDPARGLPLTDPDGRALHVSVGAAVFNLRVAARHLGRDPQVRLLPDAGAPLLAAAVDLARQSEGPEEMPAALAEPHSLREPGE
ncbi:hypothetical protein ACFV0G_21350, partial [Kitasatospora sp. NPDC059571]